MVFPMAQKSPAQSRAVTFESGHDHSTTPCDFAGLMEPIARELLGDPNSELSKGSKLRFGTHGSLSVDLEAGRWYSHEEEVGGGVLDLLARELNFPKRADQLKWLEDHGFKERSDSPAKPKQKQQAHIAATYDYCDENDELLFQAVRMEPKSFRQRRPDGNGWQWSVKDVRQVPYRLPELLARPDDPVFVVEGEKDADRLVALGLLATCNAAGAGKWTEAHSGPLANRRVIVLPDNDTAGRDHAEKVRASLEAVGAQVRVVALPDLPEKGDVSDWLDNGGNRDALVTLLKSHDHDMAAADKDGNLDTSPDPLPEAPSLPTYPVDALGPVLAPAAKRIAYHVQAPLGMACQSVLSAASLAVQGHVDVARGNIGTGPVALYLMTDAESGERKSSVDKVALGAVRAIEAEEREQFEGAITQYKADLEAWEMRRKSIISASEVKGKQAMSEAQEACLAEQLAMHDERRPKAPPLPNRTFSEPTAEGMYRHLKANHPSAGLYSDEAIGFFGGHGMSDDARGRTIEALCRFWDGAPLTRTRGTVGESGFLAGRRLSTHLMMQPVIADKVLGDPLLQGQGFLPRFLICREPSLIGQRFLADRSPDDSVDTDADIAAYRRRIDALIRKPLPVNDNGELEPRVLRIEGEPFSELCALHDGIESELAPDGAFYDVRAFASKATENAARLAAIMAVVEGDDENATITVDHINRASTLVVYYLQTMKGRTEEAQQDQQERQARELLEWITAHGSTLHQSDFKKLPSAYRSAKKARPLLDWLARAGYLRGTKYSARGNTTEWEVCHV